MSDPTKESVYFRHIEPIKVARGAPFSLFPKDRPIPFEDPYNDSNNFKDHGSIRQFIHVEGLGDLNIHFDKWGWDEEQIQGRAVLFTHNGPVELKQGNATRERIIESEFYQILGISADSSGLKLTLSFPRADIVYLAFNKYDDEYLSEEAEDDLGKIDSVFIVADEDLLHKIKAEIS